MAYEQKDMTFSLFKETTKTNPNAPDWKGQAKINGVDMRVAAWEKQGRSGVFLSGKIEPLGPKKEAPQQKRQNSVLDDDLDAPF